jgi:hypothetical protein
LALPGISAMAMRKSHVSYVPRGEAHKGVSSKTYGHQELRAIFSCYTVT